MLLMLIGVDTGMSLAKVEFKMDLDGDDSILSGFLTALKCISEMMFPQPFDRVIFGQYTMLMKAESPLLFCYVFRGSSEKATRRLHEFIGVIRKKVSLLNSLKNTISSGAVDNAAKSSIKDIAMQFFTKTA